MLQKSLNKKGGKQLNVQSKPIQENIKLSTELKLFLKSCTCPVSKKVAEDKLEEVEADLNEKCYTKNVETVKEYVKGAEDEKGEFSQLKLWKLKQKLCLKACDPPMAKRDKEGKLITSPQSLKNLYLNTYQDRLKHRNMKSALLDIYFLKQELWKSRLKELARAVGVAVGRRSGGRLATTLVATKNVFIFFFFFFLFFFLRRHLFS